MRSLALDDHLEAPPVSRRIALPAVNGLQNLRTFNRACGILALAWALLIPPWALRRAPNLVDFPQFFMGGAAVRAGIFDSLYPLPRPESTCNPGSPGDSEMRPAYARLAFRLHVGDRVRFIQPPPVALLFLPLSFLDFETAKSVWVALMGLASWGAACYAARFFALLHGRRSRWEGVILLAFTISPRAAATISWGNVSTFVPLFLGFVTMQLLRDRPARGGVAYLFGSLLKYAPAVLLPLIIAARRWRLLAWIGLGGVLTLSGSLLVMGPRPFIVYCREIVPTLDRPFFAFHNQALLAVLPRWCGRASLTGPMRAGVTAARFGLLLWILLLLRRRPPEVWRRPAPVLAAAVALISWFLIFSPVFWSHYHVYLWPFWGWLLWEAGRSRLRGIIVALIFVLTWLPWPLCYRLVTGIEAPEPLASSVLLAVVGDLGMAMSRMSERATGR